MFTKRLTRSPAARKQLNELPDDPWTKISVKYYADPTDVAYEGDRRVDVTVC